MPQRIGYNLNKQTGIVMAVEAEYVEEIEQMASLKHGAINTILTWHLANYVYPKKLGLLFDSQTNFKVPGNPPTRQPNISFVRRERLPAELETYADFAPDLVIEVASASDILTELEKKIDQYQAAGVKLVWLIRPHHKIIEIYRLGSVEPSILGVNGELDGETVIEGFKLPVKVLFEQLG